MQIAPAHFRRQARQALADDNLRQALGRARGGFVDSRAAAVAALPEFEALRDAAREIKEHTLAHLDWYLERFESRVRERGGQVHWARSAAEGSEIIVRLCRAAGVSRVTKGKSMVSEEMQLNRALAAAGIEPVETDLGEYIIQLADEPPSHIIAPAVHKTRPQITELFHVHHGRYGRTVRVTERAEIVREAREVLRDHFLGAEAGITGANFLVAECGSTVLVTNEGNGDLTASLPRLHIVTAGIEKVIPTREDLSVFLRLLARSATGQEMSVYTSLFSGPARPDDRGGPREFHVVLVDNGRSSMLGNEFHEMLRCIRCGACLNHCPVYSSIGGHAYGWVYSGPMGAVLTPLMTGLDGARDLPNACTLNGRCAEICPVRIPLPDLLRRLRMRLYERGRAGAMTRAGLAVWAWLARRPHFYQACTSLAVRLLARAGRRRGFLRRLPLASGWTVSRDFPAPQGDTFQRRWRRRAG